MPPTTVATTTTLPPTTPTTSEPATTTTSPPQATTTSSIPQQPTSWDYLQQSPTHSDFVAAINGAGLAGEFGQPGRTILAPTNQAWQDFQTNTGGVGGAELTQLLLRHIVTEALTVDQIFGRGSLPTVGGDTLVVDGGARTIDGVHIVNADNISADGGVVQWVDHVVEGPA
ncbi:MAG: fasciclin domain-containing protein [Desertimonas sp.]